MDSGSALKRKSALITGDVAIDHNIYKGERDLPHLKNKNGTLIVESPGGAALLFEIIKNTSNLATAKKKDANALLEKAKSDKDEKAENHAKQQLNNLTEYDVHLGVKISPPDIPQDHHSYALWSPCHKKGKSEERVWRMTDTLGYGGKAAQKGDGLTPLQPFDPPSTDILVLDDGALGFRSNLNKNAWPEVLRDGLKDNIEWVALKTTSPLAVGDLWTKLSSSFKEKLIVILSAADIRREEATISKDISWERAALDILCEMNANVSIRDLLKCRHLIILIGAEGALLSNCVDGKHEFSLIYDPANLEWEWKEKLQGHTFGYLSCFTAGVVNELAKPSGDIDILRGVISGLTAGRALLSNGHGKVGDDKPGFPFNAVSTAVLGSSEDFRVAKLPFSYPFQSDPNPHWTILGGGRVANNETPPPLFGMARQVALFGSKPLSNIPSARFERLFTVDRREIESFRGIKRLANNYLQKKGAAKPLSIAVFGPPGAGKSFGIKQIAASLLGKEASFLEFNLSQFKDPASLADAFHQVRDKALKGTPPFVFWDEFDSKEYTWLQYLLAPMQDGEFREGQITHPIGKCIFIFAGGTSYQWENFGPQDKEGDEYRAFKLLKGPDFISRLSGYLNVLGPNKRQRYDISTKKWIDDKPDDICFPVRRALLIRSVLGLDPAENLKIDNGVLNALLEIGQFAHGARSLENVITLTRTPNSTSLQRSDLPPREQLSLHVDYDEFMALVNRDQAFKINADKLAPAYHDYYRQEAINNGGTPKYDMEYELLPDNIKWSNIQAVRRIPAVLSLAGLKIAQENAPEQDTETQIGKIIENNIEILAQAEHNGWMEEKYGDGWEYGTVRNDDKKIHNLLVPYETLPEKEKDKDRAAVRKYPDIVKKANFRVVSI